MAVRKPKIAAQDRGAHRRPARPPARKNGHAPSVGDVPATCAMLAEARTELLERVDGLRDELRAEIHEVKAEIHEVKAEIHEVKAEIHEVKAQVARIAFLVEEQNARNKVVLDGLMAYIDRQARVEQRVDGVERTVRGLAASRDRA